MKTFIIGGLYTIGIAMLCFEAGRKLENTTCRNYLEMFVSGAKASKENDEKQEVTE